jgi:hypothetical protein
MSSPEDEDVSVALPTIKSGKRFKTSDEEAVSGSHLLALILVSHVQLRALTQHDYGRPNMCFSVRHPICFNGMSSFTVNESCYMYNAREVVK